jgi:uncharacterized protein YceH (UPF0502 family)
MTRDRDQLTANSVVRDYRFASHAPVIGPLIARLLSAWYNVAARWGDQSLINQQAAYNQAVAQRIAELAQQIAEYDQRLILTDHDLTDLTRTVAELTQQVIELRHIVAEMQAARTRS